MEVNMSEFSEKLTSYIVRSGYSVYQLAKEASLDRTTLQKTAKGQRLPSLDYIKDICRYIKISSRQEEELITLYQIEKQGWETVEAWREIDGCLNDIRAVYEKNADISLFAVHMDEKSLENFNKEIQRSYATESECIKAIMCVIEQEFMEQNTPEIFMDVSWASGVALEQCALTTYTEQSESKNFVCHQLVNLKNTEQAREGILENVKMLRQILPYALAPKNEYDVRYMYVNETHEDQKSYLWGHYIITHQHVLLCSNKKKHLVVISNKQIADVYREEVMEMMKEYRPLLDFQGFSGEGIRQYRQMINYYDTHLTYEPFPCVTLMCPVELRKMILEDPKLKEYAAAFFETPKVPSDHYINIFGMKGIKEFIETGHLPGMFDSYFVAETMEMRKIMLTSFYDQLVAAPRQFYMINEDEFDEGSSFGMELCGRNRVVFSSNAPEYPFGYIFIDESGICDIFVSFFDNFVQSKYVYSIEETIEKYEEIVRKCFEELSDKEQ